VKIKSRIKLEYGIWNEIENKYDFAITPSLSLIGNK
jgi:hypothetical protein